MPSRMRDILRAAFAVLLFANLAAAQESPRFSETIDVSLVNLEVIVTDRNGERVRGLTPGDFIVLEDGKPQTIVNFAEYAGEPQTDRVSVQSPAPARTAEAPPRQPRTFLVFVDEIALVMSKADFRPALIETLRTVLEPGDTASVMTWTTRLNVRHGFTTDLGAIERAIGALPKPGPLFGDYGYLRQIAAEEEFWRSLAFDPRNAGMIDGTGLFAESLAMTSMMDTKTKVRTINAAMTAMAGAEGRKVLLLVAHRFSRHAGREFFLPSRYDSSEPPPRNPWLDQRVLIESVAATANATGFTIYGVYPEGLQGSMDTAEVHTLPPGNGGGPAGGRDHHILMNETESLELVAGRTGGEYAFGSDVLRLLPRIAGDLTDYYSVAYRTAARGTDNRRKISVRARNRDYTVRARTEYVERSDSTRMRDRVTASVFAPIDKGTIPIRVEFGPQPAGRDTWPLKIQIPISYLATAVKDGAHNGAFTVYLAWNSRAGTSDATRKTQRFTIKAEDLERAKESYFTYNFDVRIDDRTRALGVGVLDETSKEYGVLTVPLSNSEQPAAAQYGALSSFH
jgi:VWFA-related protein